MSFQNKLAFVTGGGQILHSASFGGFDRISKELIIFALMTHRVSLNPDLHHGLCQRQNALNGFNHPFNAGWRGQAPRQIGLPPRRLGRLGRRPHLGLFFLARWRRELNKVMDVRLELG